MNENTPRPNEPQQQQITIKMNQRLSFKTLLFCAVLGVAAFTFLSHVVRDWFVSRMPSTERRVTTDSAMLESIVTQVAQLATLNLRYTEAEVYEDQNVASLFGKQFNIPGTSRRLIVRWQGDLLFGLDIEQIIINIVELEDKKDEMHVFLPQASILSHAVDLGSVEVLNESTGIFTKFQTDDLTKILHERVEIINTRPSTLVLLDEARKSAEDAIRQLLSLFVDEEYYVIRFITV